MSTCPLLWESAWHNSCNCLHVRALLVSVSPTGEWKRKISEYALNVSYLCVFIRICLFCLVCVLVFYLMILILLCFKIILTQWIFLNVFIFQYCDLTLFLVFPSFRHVKSIVKIFFFVTADSSFLTIFSYPSMSVCLSVWLMLSVCVSIWMSIFLYACHLFIHLWISLT